MATVEFVPQEIQIGDSVIMLADEFSSLGVLGPKSIGGSPVTIHVYETARSSPLID